jgi:hypothetical protein
MDTTAQAKKLQYDTLLFDTVRYRSRIADGFAFG